MPNDILKRVRGFIAPTDDTSANDLVQQLRRFEDNVYDMGQGISLVAMPRLTPRQGEPTANGIVVGPGQFRLLDTRGGQINLALAKPTAKDQGKFVVLIDIGHSANFVQIESQDCQIDGQPSVVVGVTNSIILIFCDGTNYWRL